MFLKLKQGTATPLSTMPSHSCSQALKSEGDTLKQRDKPWRSDASPKSTDIIYDHRTIEYRSDNLSNISDNSSQESKGYPLEYLSPTESLSSSLSSFPADHTSSNTDQNSIASRKEKYHRIDKATMSTTKEGKSASGPLSTEDGRMAAQSKIDRTVTSTTMSSSEDGAMVEVSKIMKAATSTMTEEKSTSDELSSEVGAMVDVSTVTLLVEEELNSQRVKHKDQLNRMKAKFMHREKKYESEIDQLRAELDEAKRELENCKQNYDSQKNLRSQQQYQIDSLKEQKQFVQEIQKERDILMDEVERIRERENMTKEELSALKVRVREDSEKRLSVMERLSTSWNAEMKQAKQREASLTSELNIVTNALKIEQQRCKNISKEFVQLEGQYQSAKTELRSLKMKRMDEEDEINEEIRLERDALERVVEEQKELLELKSDEIHIGETTMRSLKSELKSLREKFTLKKQSMGKNDVGDAGVKNLREENDRLKGEIEELQKQVESYLANMALQHEFCESLKSRIYDEQANEHEQVGEIQKLRKRVKKQQKDLVGKDLQIDELKHLLQNCSGSEATSQCRAWKKNGRRKKRSSSDKNGYRTS
mmetsp:Transcript_11196/g.26917  ORF Transcript_11196/g.26917 Transcript_11196/m.26917 type:complete len:594 (+) Transcript_11196:265-2046(+)